MDRTGKTHAALTRRHVLSGAAGMAALVAWPAGAGTERARQAPPRRPGPQDPADLLAALPPGAVTGFAVLDAATGAVLEARGETRPLPPASVQKTITALYALDRLGADRSLSTRILAHGPIQGGVLQGDLILQGGGDPTLDTDRLGDLVAALSAQGLRRVAGRFLFDDGALPSLPRIDVSQPEQAGYNPGISGLQLNFNRVNFEWTKDAGSLAMTARGERYLAPVHVASMTAVDRESPVFDRKDLRGIEAWTVARAALAREGSRWLPVRHVGPYVADVFHALCAARGISLPAPAPALGIPADATVLEASDSAPLSEVVRAMLKYSTNVTAESLGLLASGAGDLRASARVMQDWASARVGLQAALVDHSGLGPDGRIAPLALVRALREGDRTASGRALRGLLKAGGLREDDAAPIDASKVVGSKVVVRAKSGTLNFVSGLAGFIETEGGRDLVFAIQTADLDRRAAIPADRLENPPGLRGWLGRARGLQAGLIRHWAMTYGKA